ncbi:MAG: excinuclease ABC subunit UvrA [Eubacteriaceae bacterium]|nr:excinuclease ABC subunit UvrA [Eubacteriaceae bacterium]
MVDFIRIKGAKENNLKNIDLDVPRNSFNVFTGLSGSGKTSLAFDTIYAEGQRRYVESLSSYARQFLGQMNKPDVESIEGLSPAISIDQRTQNRNPRSTVGTVTEIYDYLRLLYARIGVRHCPVCGKVVESQSLDVIITDIMGGADKERFQILAPVARQEKGQFKKLFEAYSAQGYIRAFVDGEPRELSENIELDKNKKHDISIVVDRLVHGPTVKSRLADSIEAALRIAGGLVVYRAENGEERLYSENYACIECGISMGKPEPRDFSFNSPFGMCPKCSGIGYEQQIDVGLLIPDKSLSISQGAIQFYGLDSEGYYFSIIAAMAGKYGFSVDEPIGEAPPGFLNALLYGDDSVVRIKFNSYFSGRREQDLVFEGLVNNMQRRYKETYSESMKERIEGYMSLKECDACHGKKLNEKSLAVTVGGINIIQLTEMTVGECQTFITSLELTENQQTIINMVAKEIANRLAFLSDVGLSYLDLARAASTLSGGESQRIRLATQIGSQLTGVLYVLDEPSIGLHQRDNAKLIATLRKLTSIGNTLIVVEHDEETMRASDFIVDIGPGAGIHGGLVVAAGTPEQIEMCEESITGQYLSGKAQIPIPQKRAEPTGSITITGAAENNLKGIDVSFPLGVFTCVSGVSGSGKSTLVNEILFKAAQNALYKTRLRPGKHDSITGLEHVDKVINIDQSPIGRTPRSNPATYTGVFDLIRDLFASTNEAKARGYKKGRFSFNVKGGRCESCSGDGIIKIEMHFLPDVYIPCEVCKGKRYNSETLQVTYKDKNIADILDMTVEEAMGFFENLPRIRDKMATLYEVGLGYIKLGQPSTTLSGGEAQRIKLASELSRRATSKTLYILDEPTTGLHTHDVDKLLQVLQKLRDAGNTIVVIEHNLEVLKCADWIIDLGPEGGFAGGLVIAVGTPEQVSECAVSDTGKYLKKILNQNRQAGI